MKNNKASHKIEKYNLWKIWHKRIEILKDDIFQRKTSIFDRAYFKYYNVKKRFKTFYFSYHIEDIGSQKAKKEKVLLWEGVTKNWIILPTFTEWPSKEKFDCFINFIDNRDFGILTREYITPIVAFVRAKNDIKYYFLNNKRKKRAYP